MIFSTQKKKIAKVRFIFFLYEIALVFVFLFVLLIIPVFLLPLIAEEGSNLYGLVLSYKSNNSFLRYTTNFIFDQPFIRISKKNDS